MTDQPSKESLERANEVWSEMAFLREEKQIETLALEFDAIAKENARYKFALENHLCKYEIADWLACTGEHGDYCDVCEQDKNDPKHYHISLSKLRQQNAALVSALRELEQKWRMQAQSIREQTEKGKTSGCIMMATVIEWKEEADRFDAHADELKKILAPYAPAEEKEKP